MSLARAFFAAGARGVVATRWPLRDDDAAFMMERFYEGLSEGESVATALRHTRRAAIEAGLPAAAWAGVAALGDGAFRPFPEGRSHTAGRMWITVTLALAAIIVTAGAALIARRRRIFLSAPVSGFSRTLTALTRRSSGQLKRR